MANLTEAYVKSALPNNLSITTGGVPSKFEAGALTKMNGGKKNKSKKGGRHSKSRHSRKSKHNKSKKGGKKQKK